MQASRRHWWLLLTVCGLACGLRLGVWWLQGPRLNDDIDAYLEIARNLAAGSGYAMGQPPHLTAYRPPLYPLLLAAVFQCGGTPAVVGLVQVILGGVTTGFTWRCGLLLQLGRSSYVAAALVALDPLLLQYTALPMTETLCATLVVAWCWLILEYPPGASEGVWRPLLQGACFGLICLCRPGFLAAIGLFGGGLSVELWLWRGTAEARRRSWAGIWGVIGLAVILCPWVVRNAVVIGKATPATTHGGYTLLLANNPVFYREVVLQPWGTVWQGDSLNRWQQGLETSLQRAGIRPDDEVSRDRWMYHQAWSEIRAEPQLFARACLWRGVRFWDLAPWRVQSGVSSYFIAGIALFYGLITVGILFSLVSLTTLEWKSWWLLSVLPLTLWLTHLVYWTDMRMRAPVIPILALLAARALTQPTDRKTLAKP